MWCIFRTGLRALCGSIWTAEVACEPSEFVFPCSCVCGEQEYVRVCAVAGLNNLLVDVGCVWSVNRDVAYFFGLSLLWVLRFFESFE